MTKSDDMDGQLGARSLFLTILESTAIILLNVVSILGNTLVCISVYRNTRLRTSTNLYIVALAISDLLSAVFVMPFAAGVLISGNWPFGKAVCQVIAFFGPYVLYISPVTMGFTAVNRYVRMCKSNQQYKRFFSPLKSFISLASAWMLIACYILTARFTGLQGFYFESGYAVCLNQHLNKLATIIHYVFVLGLFFILPLVLTIFSYRKVLRKIQEHNAVLARSLENQEVHFASVTTHEIRISRSLFVVVFAFMLCWIPVWLITILTRLSIVDTMPRNIQLLCTIFLNLSNTVNPFIYAGMNPLFRREFRRILYCRPRESDIRQASNEYVGQRQNLRVAPLDVTGRQNIGIMSTDDK